MRKKKVMLVLVLCPRLLLSEIFLWCRLISEQQRAFGRGDRAFQPDVKDLNTASDVNKTMREMDKVSHVCRGGDYNDIGIQ